MMSQDMPREGKMKAACYFFGTVVALLGCATMVMPNWQHIYAKGPANTGHAKLTCVECHF